MEEEAGALAREAVPGGSRGRAAGDGEGWGSLCWRAEPAELADNVVEVCVRWEGVGSQGTLATVLMSQIRKASPQGKVTLPTAGAGSGH